MNDILTIDRNVRSLTHERADSRPFLCEGNPFGARIMIAGLNPGSNTPFWPYWSPTKGCNKKAWLNDFSKYTGGEKTRTAIELFIDALSPVKYIETNLYHIWSKNEASLKKTDRDSSVFEYLLKVISPKYLVTHGYCVKEKIETLCGIALSYHEPVLVTLFGTKTTVIPFHHFSRESHSFLKKFGSNIRDQIINKISIDNYNCDALIKENTLNKTSKSNRFETMVSLCNSKGKRGLGMLIYNVPKSYLKNGYIYIKVGDELIFPKPGTKIKILLGDDEEFVIGEIVQTTNARIRIKGLRRLFSNFSDRSNLVVEILPMEPLKTYRIRPQLKKH